MLLSSSSSDDDWLDLMAGAPDIFGVSGSANFDRSAVVDRDRGDRDEMIVIDDSMALLPSPPQVPPRIHPKPSQPPNDRRRKKRATFRLKGKKLFLTWPKCDTAPEVVLERILGLPGGVKWAVVSREKHLDGTWHLHAAVWLSKGVDTQVPTYLDFLAGAHGNYQVARDIVKTLRYILKDNLFVSSPGFDPETYLAARGKKVSTSFAQVAGKMVEGQTIAEVNAVSPGFVLQHLPKLKSYRSYLDSVGGEPLVDFPPIGDMLATFGDSETSIYAWLTGNLIGFPVRPRFRSRQLMIIGGTGIGKSSFVDALTKFAKPYYVPMDENFYDSYDDKEFNFCVMDEFRSQKTITFLNSFVDGSPCPLRIKGGQTTKRKNLPVIILSNWEPAISYCKVQAANPEVLDALLRRFLVVRVPSDETLYSLCDWLHSVEN